MPILAGIAIHPIKALDPHYGTEIAIGPGGTLRHDREWAIVDREGNFVNGKRCEQVHRIRAKYNLRHFKVTLREEGGCDEQTFHLVKEKEKIEAWLTAMLGVHASLKRNEKIGFPDDEPNWGPTVIGTGTLREVAGWFGLKPDDIWKRFRANLVLGGAEPFWEDRLFGKEGTTVPFSIGQVRFEGVMPCQRCIVPTRDPQTGERDREFQQVFMAKREATLPQWAKRSRFDHFFRLTVNTRIDPQEAGKQLMIGNDVKIL